MLFCKSSVDENSCSSRVYEGDHFNLSAIHMQDNRNVHCFLTIPYIWIAYYQSDNSWIIIVLGQKPSSISLRNCWYSVSIGSMKFSLISAWIWVLNWCGDIFFFAVVAAAGVFLFLIVQLLGMILHIVWLMIIGLFRLTTFVCKMTFSTTIETIKFRFVERYRVYIHWLSLIVISGG